MGFLMYYTKGVAIGTKDSVRYRGSGRLSGVVVKSGSTVYAHSTDGWCGKLCCVFIHNMCRDLHHILSLSYSFIHAIILFTKIWGQRSVLLIP